MSEPCVPDSEGFVPAQLDNHATTAELLTDEGGTLRLDRGLIRVRFRLGIKRQGKEWGDSLVSCQTQITDRDGEIWEAEGLFTPSIFVEHLVDLNRISGPGFAVNPLGSASEPGQRSALLLSGIGDFLDDRFYRFFWVEDRLFKVIFKYQVLEFEVFAESDREVIVKVSGLMGGWSTVESNEDFIPYQIVSDEDDKESEPRTDANGIPYWADFQELPPFVYRLESRHLIFRNTVDLAVYDERYFNRCDTEVPLPLRFHRTGLRAEPQPSVRFSPFSVTPA